MIQVDWRFTESTDHTVTIHILIYDPDGHGIRRYEITNNAGVVLKSDSFDCPGHIEERFDIGPIDTLQLPLTVRAMDCQDEEVEYDSVAPPHPIPSSPDSTTPSGPPAPCSSVRHVLNPACDLAVSTLVNIRNRLLRLCENMDRMRGKIIELKILASVLLVVGLACIGMGAAMIASVYLGILGAALVSLGLALIAFSIRFYVEANRLEKLLHGQRARFDELSIEFDEAVSNALLVCHCPDDFARVDTTMPCI